MMPGSDNPRQSQWTGKEQGAAGRLEACLRESPGAEGARSVPAGSVVSVPPELSPKPTGWRLGRHGWGIVALPGT